MKTLHWSTLSLAVLLSSSCDQQLVQFGYEPTKDLSQGDDLPAPTDLASRADLSAELDGSMMSGDGSAEVDMSSPSDLRSDLRSIDLLLPNRLAACAATLGRAAQSFAVLGGSTVTNTGSTTAIVGGNVGVSPGSSITGIPIGMPIGGSIHTADAVAAQAQADVTNVYTCSQAAVCDQMLTGTDLGGLTLGPGVYCFTSSAALTGNLVLDANGDPNAIWFFQIMSTLDITNNSHVHVIGGGQDCHVFWQVGSSVTVGTGAKIVGNLLSMASITLNSGASLSGRALARSGAVTLDTNDIAVPACL